MAGGFYINRAGEKVPYIPTLKAFEELKVKEIKIIKQKLLKKALNQTLELILTDDSIKIVDIKFLQQKIEVYNTAKELVIELNSPEVLISNFESEIDDILLELKKINLINIFTPDNLQKI